MDKKLDWDFSRPQKIDSHNTYLDGGEILGAVCPPHGYIMWASTTIEEYSADVIIYGNGDTEADAELDMLGKIAEFLAKWLKI